MSIPSFYIRHVAISVQDADETIDWYSKCLGFEVVSRGYHPPTDSELIVMVRGGVELEIFCRKGSKSMTEERKNPDLDPGTQGVKHFCLGTDDLDGLMEHLSRFGVEIVVGPVMMGDVKLYYIHDNSGNPIELMQEIK